MCIVALFSIAPAEIALNAFVISIAIFALVWIGIAKKNLSKGSSLGMFALYLFSSISFFLLTSIVQLTIRIFNISILVWPTYISMSIAYLMLVVSAYKLMRIGKEFGFSVEKGKIKEMIKKRGMKERLEKLEKIKKENLKKRP